MSGDLVLTCPGHGTEDLVRSVPAVYAEGTAQLTSTGPVVGLAGGQAFVGRINQQGTLQTSTALRLSPLPQLKSGIGFIVLGTIELAFALGIIATGGLNPATQVYGPGEYEANPSARVGFATLGLVIFLATAALMYGRAYVRVQRRTRVQDGQATALPVWRAGWYCGRCDGVFFRPGTVPAELPVDQLLPPDTFRTLVWRAGGYTEWGKPAD